MLVPSNMPYIVEASREAIKQIKIGVKGMKTSTYSNQIERLEYAERYLHRLKDRIDSAIVDIGILITKEFRKQIMGEYNK